MFTLKPKFNNLSRVICHSLAAGGIACGGSISSEAREKTHDLSYPTQKYNQNLDRAHLKNEKRDFVHSFTGKPRYSSIKMDERRDVYLSEAEYDAVSILKVQGYHQCSSVIVEIEGVKDVFDRAIVLTVGHCPLEEQNAYIEAEHLDQRNIIRKFIGYIEQSVSWDNNGRQQDMAIAALHTSIPSEIVPALLKIDHRFKRGDLVSIAGYSRDKVGLTEHKNCKIKRANMNGKRHTIARTDCDVVSGNSGSPLIVDRVDNSNQKRLIVAGSASNIQKNNLLVTVNLVTSHHIQNAPFLIPNEWVDQIKPSGTSCKIVTSSSLNVRPTPSTQYKKISKLGNGDIVSELYGINGWNLIKFGDDQVGYSSAKYLSSVPCP